MAWPVFPALVLLGIGALLAFLAGVAYSVTAYANAISDNTRAYRRDMLRGLVALAVMLACIGGVVAIGVATDPAPPSPSPERSTQP